MAECWGKKKKDFTAFVENDHNQTININEKKIFEIISTSIRVPISKIKLTSKSNDYEKWDSIAQVRIFVELERLINRKIDTKYMEKLQSVKKILDPSLFSLTKNNLSCGEYVSKSVTLNLSDA